MTPGNKHTITYYYVINYVQVNYQQIEVVKFELEKKFRDFEYNLSLGNGRYLTALK